MLVRVICHYMPVYTQSTYTCLILGMRPLLVTVAGFCPMAWVDWFGKYIGILPVCMSSVVRVVASLTAWPPPGVVPYELMNLAWATLEETGWSIQSDSTNL